VRLNSIPQGKQILLLCHPTWLASRDLAKPLLSGVTLKSQGFRQPTMGWLVQRTQSTTTLININYQSPVWKTVRGFPQSYSISILQCCNGLFSGQKYHRFQQKIKINIMVDICNTLYWWDTNKLVIIRIVNSNNY
jgi:hypothetical protein